MANLSGELKKLETEYNQFFSGRLPRPPWEARTRVESLIRKWDRESVNASSVDKFKFQALRARYATFADLWDRALRAREEGRPGPFNWPSAVPTKPPVPGEAAAPHVVHVAAIGDPMKDIDKVRELYESLMEARRKAGDRTVPFHRFVGLVRDQVRAMQQTGSPEVTFRVIVTDGKVSFTAMGLKGWTDE
ncbi:MAG TPA: MXAN_5187 C-terminal domain-containing protein [Vicinamibacterales bacterium]|nr:MXAN_5187 C-terminal domain-containing protein [Vicinamibacterales bacterium]